MWYAGKVGKHPEPTLNQRNQGFSIEQLLAII